MPDRKPLPPSYFNISLILIIGLHFIFPIRQVIDWPYRWLGLVVAGLGAWITLWSDNLFKKYGTEVKPYKKSSRLVTDGPYRISRHPMYLGMFGILLGVALLMGSLIAFIPFLGFIFCMQLIFIPVEERMMKEQFGDEYRQYCRKVRQWI